MNKYLINETFVAILKYMNNGLISDSINIDDYFQKEFIKFEKICTNSSLDEIILFFQKEVVLNQLNGYYGYCEYLTSAFEGFTVNINDTVTEIQQKKEIFLFNKQQNPETYNLEKNVNEYIENLKKKFKLWLKAYSINKVYEKCNSSNEILTFSHRNAGWANPVYRLNKNFSIELKSNFGYGRASYFYTILTYKSISITPFSDWVIYEFANFEQIIRYTQSYLVKNAKNDIWYDALEYAKDACNLSAKDEVAFVKKYIIEECEKMVNGLEGILKNHEFNLKNNEKEIKKVDKKGYNLIKFRGEKISGSLDFLVKIIEYKRITEIDHFVQKIEQFNKILQPILKEEIIKIEKELSVLISEMNILSPKYELSLAEYREYINFRDILKLSLIESEELDEDNFEYSKFEKIFNEKYPKFSEIEKRHSQLRKEYIDLKGKIDELKNFLSSITKYENKINEHFKSKK